MIFRIKGVEVSFRWHFLTIVTFMLSLRASNVLYAVVFSLLHEIGHLAAMASAGVFPESISFEFTGINIKRKEMTNVSLQKEIIISFAGPFVNLILFLALLIAFLQSKNVKMLNMASVNLILMAFNLLPVKSLDGGKIIYYTLWKTVSHRFASALLKASSCIFIFLLIIYGVYVFYTTKYNFTILIISLMLALSMFSSSEC